MTTAELINRLNQLSLHRTIKCLEIGDQPEDNRVFHIVNVHEDLAGVHLIIELWDGAS